MAEMLWTGLFWPLLRLVFYVSIGLMVANIIETLNWTRHVAKAASPLIRVGRLSDTSGASFSLAFFSGVSANTMLAEAFDQGKMSKRELILANLFNSLPTYFLHLPTMFFITLPLIKGAAFVYVGLTFGASVLRTFSVLLLGKILLPERDGESCVSCRLEDEGPVNFREALVKAFDRFKARIQRILIYTVPIYICFFFLNRSGMFRVVESFLENHVQMLSWLHPESLSIVVFHIAAEFTAGIAAAGALLDGGTLSEKEIVLALLVGNILSSPIRALRHQYPYYAGIFNPRLALELIMYNQFFRMMSIILMALAYAVYF